MQYIDTHTHLNLSSFDADRNEVLGRMREAGVTAINVGTCRSTSTRAVALAEEYPECYATVGVHPSDVVTPDAEHGVTDSDGHGGGWDYEAFKALALHPKVVAIGEVGFDYYHHGDAPETVTEEQRVFSEQIALANEVNKPLMLHIRHKQGTRDAYADAHAVLKADARVPGNVHFFAGTVDHARMFFELGYTISFTGVLTFTHDYDDVVRFAPLEMLHAETDAPFATPVPHRGKRNEPLYVVEVIRAIARIKELPFEDVASALKTNARRLYGVHG